MFLTIIYKINFVLTTSQTQTLDQNLKVHQVQVAVRAQALHPLAKKAVSQGNLCHVYDLPQDSGESAE